MASRKKSGWHRTKNMTIPLGPVIGLIAMPNLMAAIGEAMDGDRQGVIDNLTCIVGIDHGVLNMTALIANMTPLFIGMAVHWAASKFGLNRALGRAGVPIIRF